MRSITRLRRKTKKIEEILARNWNFQIETFSKSFFIRLNDFSSVHSYLITSLPSNPSDIVAKLHRINIENSPHKRRRDGICWCCVKLPSSHYRLGCTSIFHQFLSSVALKSLISIQKFHTRAVPFSLSVIW